MAGTNEKAREAIDLALSCLKWWRDARFMVSGHGWGERNVFDDEPDFIRKARSLVVETGLADPSDLDNPAD